mgnify:CR=1 FL=1
MCCTDRLYIIAFVLLLGLFSENYPALPVQAQGGTVLQGTTPSLLPARPIFCVNVLAAEYSGN